MGGISFWQILIIVLVVLVLFGGNRLRNLGGDLGKSLKDFKREMSSKEAAEAEKSSSSAAAESSASADETKPDQKA